MGAAKQKAPTIMVVDDDELIISSLRGLFTLETDYEILPFTDARDALQEARRRPIDVVISDFLMPRMNGVDLLKTIREVQPETVRVLLTGFADKENAIRAINEVGLYQYVEKPWDNQDLLLLLRNALRERSLRRQLAEKVDELGSLIREHRDLSDRHRSLERELEMAARVQRSLIPTEMPAIDGFLFDSHYRPSTTLGGDYYDYALNKTHTYLLVSDVSGHGVQAALTSMLLKAIFQETAAKATGPVALLAEMSTRLHRFLPSGIYTCAAVVVMEPGSPVMRIANAGLPYPYLLDAENGRPYELPVAGIPLGLFGEAIPDGYDEREIELHPGDVLLLASDGLGDLRDPSNNFFHDGPLRKTLEALPGKTGAVVIENLVSRADEFRQGQSYPDDIVIVAVTKT